MYFFVVNINIARAGSVAGFGGSTEITQIANNVQLVGQLAEQAQQTQHQLSMYMTMVRNLENLRHLDFDKPQAVLMQLHGLIQSAYGISYQMGMSDKHFSQLYPEYYKMLDLLNTAAYASQQEKWTDSVLAMCKAALRNADLNVSSMQSDAQVLGVLTQASKTAPGQKAAIQAGNEIAAQMVTKLVELKGLTAAQVQSQNVYLATKEMEKNTTKKASIEAHQKRIDVDLNDNKPLTRKRIRQ